MVGMKRSMISEQHTTNTSSRSTIITIMIVAPSLLCLCVPITVTMIQV